LPVRLLAGCRTFFTLRSYYIKENFMLKEKAAILALEMERFKEIALENERFRELLDFRNKHPLKSIAAEVIGRVPSTWSRLVLINKGERHGIKRRMAVCTSVGLVGIVAETGPFTSKVMLLTDPNSRVGVILADSRQTGILAGTDSGNCKVIYLDMDNDAASGERVSTSGFGGLFPKGIPIGTVKKLGKDNVGLYGYAIVKPYQEMNEIEEVVCIE